MNADAREERAPLIKTPDALKRVVDAMRDEPVYAIDTEFQGEHSYFPKLALVQVAWSEGIALIDPLAVDVAPLGEVLSGPGIAVLHACSQDLPILERACGARPTRLFDPQVAGAFLGHGRASLGNLLRGVIGVEVSKGSQLADWMRRPLAERELRYAASDVRYLLPLREALLDELKERGRDEWVELECIRELDRHRWVFCPERAWWKMKGKGKLRGRARGVAQALADWRERRARSSDRLVKHILSDMAIMGMAQRPPKNPGHVRGTRGMRRDQMADTVVSEILDAVERGVNLSDAELEVPPRPAKEGNMRAALALAMAW